MTDSDKRAIIGACKRGLDIVDYLRRYDVKDVLRWEAVASKWQPYKVRGFKPDTLRGILFEGTAELSVVVHLLSRGDTQICYQVYLMFRNGKDNYMRYYPEGVSKEKLKKFLGGYKEFKYFVGLLP